MQQDTPIHRVETVKRLWLWCECNMRFRKFRFHETMRPKIANLKITKMHLCVEFRFNWRWSLTPILCMYFELFHSNWKRWWNSKWKFIRQQAKRDSDRNRIIFFCLLPFDEAASGICFCCSQQMFLWFFASSRSRNHLQSIMGWIINTNRNTFLMCMLCGCDGSVWRVCCECDTDFSACEWLRCEQTIVRTTVWALQSSVRAQRNQCQGYKGKLNCNGCA